MKKLIQGSLLIILILLTVSSCKTPQQKAERLIKRANSIYPIDSLVSERIKIDTVLRYDTVIVVKEDTLKVSVPIYEKVIDTVLKLEKFIPIVYKNKKIYDNEKAVIYISSDKNGNLSFDVTVKQKEILVQGEVKYKKEIVVLRKYIHTTTKLKGIIYWIGWIAITISIILTIRTVVNFFKRNNLINRIKNL